MLQLQVSTSSPDTFQPIGFPPKLWLVPIERANSNTNSHILLGGVLCAVFSDLSIERRRGDSVTSYKLQSLSVRRVCRGLFFDLIRQSFFGRSGRGQKRRFPCLDLGPHDLHLPDAADHVTDAVTEFGWRIPAGPHLINVGQNAAPAPVEHWRNHGDLRKVNDLKTDPVIAIGIRQVPRLWQTTQCLGTGGQRNGVIKRPAVRKNRITL